MWYGLYASLKANSDFAHSAAELLQSTLRQIIGASAVIYLIWHSVACRRNWGGTSSRSRWR